MQLQAEKRPRKPQKQAKRTNTTCGSLWVVPGLSNYGKKHQTLTSQKRSSASVPDFFGVSSQRPATKIDDAKVVSKSDSSESGEHSKLNTTKSIASSSGSSVMENRQANASFPGYRPVQHAWGINEKIY